MYENKTTDYFTHVRTDIVAALGKGYYENVLELGAGGCDTILYMKEKGLAKNITGVELFELKNSNQQNSSVDHVYIASIENLQELPLKPLHYDLIICGDILEHIFDPWAVLRKVHNLLSPDGVLAISIPNFREFDTMRKIFLKGDFAYDPEGGILDKTHVRFFCKRNIIDLVKSCGFQVIKIAPTFKWASDQKRRRIANTVTFGILEQFIAFQYLVLVNKALNEDSCFSCLS